MTKNEFYPVFKVLASSCLRNEDEIKLKAETYFRALQDVAWETLDDIVNSEIKHDDNLRNHLQAPAYYRRLCFESIERKKQLAPVHTDLDKQEIQNGIKFVNLLGKAYNKKNDPDLPKGMANMAGCFGLLAKDYYKRWQIDEKTGRPKDVK